MTAEALEIKSLEDLTVWESDLVTCIFTGINGLGAHIALKTSLFEKLLKTSDFSVGKKPSGDYNRVEKNKVGFNRLF